MKKLLVLLSITFLFALAGCSNTTSPDNSETESPTNETFSETIISGEAQNNSPTIETEPTHATLEWRHGITLNYPIDWRYLDDGNLQIFPHDRPYRSTWYERTVFEITSRSLSPRHEQDITICSVEWLEGNQNSDYAESIFIDGVQAFYTNFIFQQDNRTMHPYNRTAVYTFIHKDRFFQMELRSGDGCEIEWAIMEEIRDSIRFDNVISTVIDISTTPHFENATITDLSVDQIQLKEKAFRFAIEFVIAFNDDDVELLQILMTPELFLAFQEAKNKGLPNPYDMPGIGIHWATSIFIGNLNVDQLDHLKNTPIQNISMGSAVDFTPNGNAEIIFVFNIVPKYIDWRTSRPYDPALEVVGNWTDRWNVAVEIIYDGDGGFLVDDFAPTWDR